MLHIIEWFVYYTLLDVVRWLWLQGTGQKISDNRK